MNTTPSQLRAELVRQLGQPSAVQLALVESAVALQGRMVKLGADDCTAFVRCANALNRTLRLLGVNPATTSPARPASLRKDAA